MGLPDRFGTALAAAIAVAACVAPAVGQDPQSLSIYFEALRERGLYGVAERYGLSRRTELPEGSAESVQLAVELSRTFARHASAVASSEEQAFLRQRAEEILSDYRGDERIPRIDAIVFEHACRLSDRAELAWWTWNAAPDDPVLRKSASDLLSRARAAFKDWIDRGAELAAKPAASRSNEDLTRRELAGMLYQARVKSIDLLLLTAELSDSKNERERALRLAEEAAKPLAASAERGNTATLKSFSIRIARLAGDENELKALVRQSSNDRSPPALRQEAAAELARYELDHARFESAAQALIDSKSSIGETSDRLRALHVEAVIGMAGRAGPDRDRLLASAQSENDRVIGPWRLRNDHLLQRARDSEKFGERAAALLERGHHDFRAGRRDEAVSLYRDAADAATAPAAKAELHLMTASLLVEAGRFNDAIADCDQAAREAPSASVAAKSSILAAYCRGRIWSESRDAGDRQNYKDSLTKHLERFGSDGTAGDAAWMLETLAEQEGRWREVVAADRIIPESHPRAGESTMRAVRATLRGLEQLRTAGGSSIDGQVAEEWTESARRLSDRLLKSGGKDFAAARRTLDAAMLLAAVPQPDFRNVLSLLNRIPAPPPGTPADEWQQLGQEAAALRLICLTSTGQFDDAAATLEQLRSVSIPELMSVLTKLSDAGRQLTGRARAELGRLELATIRRIRLQGAGLSAMEQQRLGECEAEALFATGQFDEAAKMFAQAAVVNTDLLPRLAESLTKTGQKPDLVKARDLWQQIESKQKQGSRPWFEARLKLAGLLKELGQTADCRRLIASTRIVYPELGGPESKQAFEEFEKQLE